MGKGGWERVGDLEGSQAVVKEAEGWGVAVKVAEQGRGAVVVKEAERVRRTAGWAAEERGVVVKEARVQVREAGVGVGVSPLVGGGWGAGALVEVEQGMLRA